MAEWKEILDGRYIVSNEGELIGKSGNPRKYYVNANGYATVGIKVGNVSKAHKVHRLVAEAFIPNPDNLPFVNHIDGNKLNNHVHNLEWCTASHNVSEAYRLGLASQNSQHKAIQRIDKETGEVLDLQPSITQAVRNLGYDDWDRINDMIGNISACAKGRKQTAYGYKWRYLNE